jgi:hypothetical protein
MPVGVCLHLSMGMSMSIGMSRAYRVVMSIVFLIFSIESDEAHAGGSAEVARWVGWADPGESGVILTRCRGDCNRTVCIRSQLGGANLPFL